MRRNSCQQMYWGVTIKIKKNNDNRVYTYFFWHKYLSSFVCFLPSIKVLGNVKNTNIIQILYNYIYITKFKMVSGYDILRSKFQGVDKIILNIIYLPIFFNSNTNIQILYSYIMVSGNYILRAKFQAYNVEKGIIINKIYLSTFFSIFISIEILAEIFSGMQL